MLDLEHTDADMLGGKTLVVHTDEYSHSYGAQQKHGAAFGSCVCN